MFTKDKKSSKYTRFFIILLFLIIFLLFIFTHESSSNVRNFIIISFKSNAIKKEIQLNSNWDIAEKLDIIFGIIGFLVFDLFLFFVTLFIRKKRKKNYDVIWKSSKKIIPEDFLKIGGYSKIGYVDFYLKRKEDELLFKQYRKNKNILIIGSESAGKSRMIFNCIKQNKIVDLLIPKRKNIEDEFLPFRFNFFRKKIKKLVILDDLDDYFNYENFQDLFHKYLMTDNIRILASCNEHKYNLLNDMSKDYCKRDLDELFDTIIKIENIDQKKAEEIRMKLNLSSESVEFDGTFGSLMIPIKKYKQNFEKLEEEEQRILKIVKYAYEFGINTSPNHFPINLLKKLFLKIYGISFESKNWGRLLNKLKMKKIINVEKNEIILDKLYLDKIIPFNENLSINKFKDQINLFKTEFEIIYSIGWKLLLLGTRLRKMAFIKLAIDCYEILNKEIFKQIEKDQYVKIQNYIGLCYLKLSNISNSQDYIKQAIINFNSIINLKYKKSDFYLKALNNRAISYILLFNFTNDIDNYEFAVRDLEELLKQKKLRENKIVFSEILNNIGIAYMGLAAKNKDETSFLKKSIKSFEKSIKNLNGYPIKKIGITANLGLSHFILGQRENQVLNYKKAIEIYKEVLADLIYENSQQSYIQKARNLATMYRLLADSEDTVTNVHKAISILEELLDKTGNTIESNDLAQVYYNLGAFHIFLASLGHDKKDNLKIALEYLQKTNTYFKKEKHQRDIANTINLVAQVYYNLATIEDGHKNCIKALTFYKKAQSILTKEKFSETYALISFNMGNCYILLSNYKDKINSILLAIEKLEEALELRNIEISKVDYAKTIFLLGVAYRHLAEYKNNLEDCKVAKEKFTESLEIFKEDFFPKEYAVALQELGDSLWFIAKFENAIQNYVESIEFLNKALDVFQKLKLEFYISKTLFIMGNSFKSRGQYIKEEKFEFYGKALLNYKKAKELIDKNKNPDLFIRILNNLSNLYKNYFDENTEIEYLKLAIKLSNEAKSIIKIIDKEKFALICLNLSDSYFRIAKIENSLINFKNAFSNLKKAEEIFTFESNAEIFIIIQFNISSAYFELSKIEKKKSNCSKAIKNLQKLKQIIGLDYNKFMPKISENIKIFLKNC